jgi:hypothetical protein
MHVNGDGKEAEHFVEATINKFGLHSCQKNQAISFAKRKENAGIQISTRSIRK